MINSSHRISVKRPRQVVAALLLIALTSGCSALHPAPQPSFYSINNTWATSRTAPQTPPALPLAASAPTLIVNPPHAAAGFDSKRIIYSHEAHQLEYFARSEWIDTPARMIAPLIVAAIEKSGTFRAVVLTPSAAAGDLRLDTEIVRLQHDFNSAPSRVHFTLRAYLVDNKTRRVLASREFNEAVASDIESPYGGVVAANRAVLTVLEQLAIFCAETAGRRTSVADKEPGRLAPTLLN